MTLNIEMLSIFLRRYYSGRMYGENEMYPTDMPNS